MFLSKLNEDDDEYEDLFPVYFRLYSLLILINMLHVYGESFSSNKHRVVKQTSELSSVRSMMCFDNPVFSDQELCQCGLTVQLIMVRPVVHKYSWRLFYQMKPIERACSVSKLNDVAKVFWWYGQTFVDDVNRFRKHTNISLRCYTSRILTLFDKEQ